MAVELRDIDPLRPLLAHPPLAVLSDIDGTLAPIVPNPEDARITGRARKALSALMSSGVRIGFVTGRSLDMVQRMAGPPGAYVAASHGLEIYAGGNAETPEAVRPWMSRVQMLLAEIGPIDVPGVIIEDKGAIVAFHYRKAESEREALSAIMRAIQTSDTAKLFGVHNGRRVIELRPPLDLDKGTGAMTLMERLGARAAVCMGDDATDLDMFRAVKMSGLPSATMAIANPEESAVLEGADYFVDGVEGAEWLLEELLRVIRPSSG
jgi:trehalose 6-phosphate phosphatase